MFELEIPSSHQNSSNKISKKNIFWEYENQQFSEFYKILNKIIKPQICNLPFFISKFSRSSFKINNFSSCSNSLFFTIFGWDGKKRDKIQMKTRKFSTTNEKLSKIPLKVTFFSFFSLFFKKFLVIHFQIFFLFENSWKAIAEKILQLNRIIKTHKNEFLSFF